jgi:adenylate cyclase
MVDDEVRFGPPAIRAQLKRILDSADFDASERNRSFLGYVVEEALSGRSAQIKAYTIATSVFGRGADFDPQLDSIVRIEAGRLRRSLDNYYFREGADDPVRIIIPKGTYVPTFQSCGAPSPKADTLGGDPPALRKRNYRHGPAIFVAPFEEEGDQTDHPNFTHGLTRQIIVGLSRFTDLFVFGPSTTFGSGMDPDRDRLRAELGVDFLLTGGTWLSATRFGIEVLLIDASDGQCLWGETFTRRLEPGEILELRDEVASRVVRALAQPYGIISGRALETDGDHPESMSSINSVVRFHSYWRTYDPEMFEPVRAGLESTIATDPGYAEAYACLSQMYTNAARFGHDLNLDADDPLQRALGLAHRAIELAPGSSRGHHALGLAFWFSGNVSGSLEALEAGLALNPNDSEIMADLGLRRAMLTEWEKAVPLLEESYARNPAQPGPYRIGLALYHLAHGRFAAALDEARRTDAPHVVYGHLVASVAAARLGRTEDADASMQSLLAIDSGYLDHIVDDLQSRNLHPDLIALLTDGLRANGYEFREISGTEAAPDRSIQGRSA